MKVCNGFSLLSCLHMRAMHWQADASDLSFVSFSLPLSFLSSLQNIAHGCAFRFDDTRTLFYGIEQVRVRCTVSYHIKCSVIIVALRVKTALQVHFNLKCSYLHDAHTLPYFNSLAISYRVLTRVGGRSGFSTSRTPVVAACVEPML
jgi:hypothetical protein